MEQALEPKRKMKYQAREERVGFKILITLITV
jgi:hypothetical protein